MSTANKKRKSARRASAGKRKGLELAKDSVSVSGGQSQFYNGDSNIELCVLEKCKEEEKEKTRTKVKCTLCDYGNVTYYNMRTHLHGVHKLQMYGDKICQHRLETGLICSAPFHCSLEEE